jgi:hypothetical protein
MLTNYMNVGFIHLLFPNALILHVAREPMDTIFSAFKHDFPPGVRIFLVGSPASDMQILLFNSSKRLSIRLFLQRGWTTRRILWDWRGCTILTGT